MGKRQADNACDESTDAFGYHARAFRTSLECQHYAPATLANYDSCLGALRELVRERQIDLASFNEGNVGRLITTLQRHDRHKSRRSLIAFVVRRFLRYLVESGVVMPPVAETDASARGRLKQEYEDYLRIQRGLSERSIYNCWSFAERFLEFRFKGKDGDLAKITPSDIVRFMQHLISRGRPFRDNTPPTHLRNFFQFLFKSGKTDRNLAPTVPRIARQPASTLPRHLSPEQVEAVVAAAKVDTPIGRRDYAMVLLLARLGLRGTEVIAIQLDDTDWRAGELLIRGKGQLHDRLPLPGDVGEALANYIRHDRNTSSRALFVRDRAPRVAFADAQIVNAALQRAFEKTELKPPRYVGSHILRHSLATNMVRRGASLGEIGDVLRHRAHRSTMIYARLDVEGLRTVAREWPMPGGDK
jgi:integrase/recombinase XerD